MPIDRKAFFEKARNNPFGGSISQRQVEGVTFILDEWDKSRFGDLRQLAYMLATTFHETGREMQPINEKGGTAYFTKLYEGRRDLGNTKKGDGARFHGRGYVQLTGRANYQKASDKFGQDFIGNPDLALRPDLAAKIMFSGMTEGWFTGKELADYINADGCDYKNARRIINGTDKAVTIAGYAASFEKALAAPQTAPAPDPAPVPPPPAVEPPVAAPEPSGGVSAATAAKAGAIATMFSTLGGWWTLIPVALIAIAVVAYLVYRNRK